MLINNVLATFQVLLLFNASECGMKRFFIESQTGVELHLRIIRLHMYYTASYVVYYIKYYIMIKYHKLWKVQKTVL